jgi:small subunit ribosomal protein S16
MLRIRLRRTGTRNRPYYRIVVSDSRRAPGSEIVEELGYYDAVPNPPRLSLDRERAKAWIGRGARASETILSMLRRPEATS